MIIDQLANAEKYFPVHPLFPKAFEYIRSQDFDKLEPGHRDIEGDRLRSVVVEAPGVTAVQASSKFECHNKYIDIQVCLGAGEQMGWKCRQDCIRPIGKFDAENDYIFYGDKPDTYFQLGNRQFVIFFPDDVHAPMIGKGMMRKLVVKVRL